MNEPTEAELRAFVTHYWPDGAATLSQYRAYYVREWRKQHSLHTSSVAR